MLTDSGSTTYTQLLLHLLRKICHAYPAIMKLGTVIPYLKKIQKLYKSRDTSLEFF